MIDFATKTSAWTAAYRHANWRTEADKTEFADYLAARTTSSDIMVVRKHYGDWMAQR